MMTMTPAFTKTDVPASEWMLDDAVTRLREWGTELVCVLPSSPPAKGSAIADILNILKATVVVDTTAGVERAAIVERTALADHADGADAAATVETSTEAEIADAAVTEAAVEAAVESTIESSIDATIEATDVSDRAAVVDIVDSTDVSDRAAVASYTDISDRGAVASCVAGVAGVPSLVTIGAAESCTLRLEDPQGRISRVHAELVRRDRQWLLRDLGSKNGLRIDGSRRSECVLQPGAEIGIGPRTLIAESARSVALQSFLARLLGWRRDRIDVIDHALRSMRTAAARRGALVLCGDGDLVPLAHSLHRHSLGADRPFIVCDPRRRRGKATVRAAENFDSGMDAYAAAAGGSLCVRGYRLPKDFHKVVAALRSPESRVQLIVCSPGPESDTQFLSVPVCVPPLASRPDEIDRIIREYAADALSDLRAPRGVFTDVDREWVRMYSAKSLPDIEKGTLRLVAINLSPNVSSAAERLGMAAVSLSRWIGRRKLPVHLAR